MFLGSVIIQVTLVVITSRAREAFIGPSSFKLQVHAASWAYQN